MSAPPTAAPPAPPRVPAAFAEALRPYLASVSEDVVTGIRAQVPEYDRPADPAYVRNIRDGVEAGLRLFLDRVAGTDDGTAALFATYETIGRGEAHEGRSLEPFQTALRLGARIAWNRFHALADTELLPREAMAAAMEAVFVHLDQISRAASAGHADGRLHAAGELARRRDRLLRLLTEPSSVPAEAVRDLARAARWSLPGTLAVIAVDLPPEDTPGRPIVPPEFLVRYEPWPARMVVPDPVGRGRARDIERVLRGHRAALGPAVPVTEGAHSLRLATEALELARRGILPSDRVIRCEAHLSTLLLFQNEALTDALAEQLLRPLQRIRTPHRERLAETLLCWIQQGRNASEVAGVLGVHPQTVRYRLRQLDELYGERLHDPDTCFELELVLRAERTRQAAAAPATTPGTTGSAGRRHPGD